jgi:hypothetical protein
MLVIPSAQLCMNLFDDYFWPNIDFSLLQDEYRPRLRRGVLKFFYLVNFSPADFAILISFGLFRRTISDSDRSTPKVTDASTESEIISMHLALLTSEQIQSQLTRPE